MFQIESPGNGCYFDEKCLNVHSCSALYLMQSEQKNSEANLSSQKVEGSWERADKLNMMSTSPTKVFNSTLISL